MSLPSPASVSVSPPPSREPPAPASTGTGQPAPAWHSLTLVAFRFCVVYFGLYFLTTQMLGSFLTLPGVHIPDLGEKAPMRLLVMWVGHHILHVQRPFAPHPTGSGDTAYNWVHLFTVLLVAAVCTAVWTALDRRTRRYDRLYAWFRLGMRFALGTSLLTYGLAKAIPLQMPAPFLTRLIEPYGNFSPMGVLWSSIGASYGYEIFVGLAETCAGVLLLVPRTTMVGVLMALMDVIAVLTLNLTYDVPVKLFAFHLVLFSLVLLAPSARTLCDFFFLRRRVELREEPPVAASPLGRRIALAAQVALGAAVLLTNTVRSAHAWSGPYGGGAPHPPLYGIWNVSQMTVDGTAMPALLGDSTRWRRALFELPGRLFLQDMSDRLHAFQLALDTTAHTLTLTTSDSAHGRSSLSYTQPTSTRMLVDGTLAGRTVHMELTYQNPDSFTLRSRGFNWIQEYPFNR